MTFLRQTKVDAVLFHCYKNDVNTKLPTKHVTALLPLSMNPV